MTDRRTFLRNISLLTLGGIASQKVMASNPTRSNTRHGGDILGNRREKDGLQTCAPLPDLSCDYGVDYEITLSKACLDLEQKGYVDTESLRHYPSILFGLETAMRHYEQGGWRHYDTPFSQGQAGIPINGLIWMGDYKYMLEQVEEKMKEGFRCVKLKIGAIDFDRELSLLKHIRAHFSAKEIELRVDANGAFTPSEAMDKLKRLAEMDFAFHRAAYPCRAVGRDGTPCGRVTPSHRSRRGTDRL